VPCKGSIVPTAQAVVGQQEARLPDRAQHDPLFPPSSGVATQVSFVLKWRFEPCMENAQFDEIRYYNEGCGVSFLDRFRANKGGAPPP